jgi:hypothetical protein
MAGVLGLLVLVVGLAWAERDMGSMNGVALVGLGVLGLVLGAVVAGVHEGATRRRSLPR